VNEEALAQWGLLLQKQTNCGETFMTYFLKDKGIIAFQMGKPLERTDSELVTGRIIGICVNGFLGTFTKL